MADPSGALATLETRPDSVGRMFFDRVAATPDREAYRYPSGDGWTSMTWGEAGERVTTLAAGLIALGIEPEQRVAIASGTRYEWILADLAIMSAGAATTTVYPSSISEDVAYILGDSDSHVVFAEDDVQIAKLRERRADLPALTKVVTFDGSADDDWVITLADLEELGVDLLAKQSDVVSDRIDATTPDNLATLIYTSGTTGRPKGVRLRHSAWTYEGYAVDAVDILSPDDLQFLWLPLAHSFGKVLLSAQLAIGFSTAVDGTVEKIIDNLAVIKPTFMGAAPRIFEKAHARVNTMAADEGGVKKMIFDQAFRVGAGGVAPKARRQVRATASVVAARALRSARVRKDPAALRRSAAVLRVRSGGAQPGHRRMVRRRRHPHPRGLRPHRDVGRHLRQPPDGVQDRDRGDAVRRHPDQDRR